MHELSIICMYLFFVVLDTWNIGPVGHVGLTVGAGHLIMDKYGPHLYWPTLGKYGDNRILCHP